MISLFLNTSSNFLNISIAKDNKILNSLYKKLDKDLSKEVLYEISNLLKEENLTPNDIDEIICVRGPGSFTGLRVGATIAKTYAHFLNKKLYSVSSLEVIATTKKDDIIVPMIDARRGYVYGAIYDKDYNVLLEEQYIKFDLLIEKVKSYNKSTTLISNDNLKLETLKINPNLNELYKYNFKKEENPMNFEPNYLKKPEAEEKLNDKNS